jgi:serine/threonine protein phosphatase PrpC
MVRSCLTGKDDEDYFAVFDGHGGKHASRFAADNLHLILGGIFLIIIYYVIH